MSLALRPTPDAAVLTAPLVSDFTVARVSGIAPERLDALALSATHAALRRALAAEHELEQIAAVIEAALYPLVPALADEPQLRRAALSLKRDVHNARMPKLEAETLATLSARLDPAAAAAVDRWIVAARVRAAAMATAGLALDDERDLAGAALAAELCDRGMRRALALGSPAFLDEALRRDDGGAGAAPGSRFARTAVGYLSRAALKTSPFSSFTEVALGRMDTHVGEQQSRSAPRHRVQLARAVAVQWLLTCARDERLADRFEYERVRSLRYVDGRPVLIIASYRCADGFYWRRDDVTDATVLLDDLQQLAGIERADRATILLALGGADPKAAFSRLLDLGVLRPVTPWTAGADDPLDALGQALRGTPVERAIGAVADATRALACSGGRERIELLRTIRGAAVNGVGRLDTVAPWVAEAALVYEDVRAEATVAPLGTQVRADLERLGALMRPQIVRSRLYDELTTHFVKRFGAAGECGDVLGFLLGFLADPGVGASFERVIAQDAGARERPARGAADAPVGPSSAPPCIAVAFQIVASNQAAVERGDYLIVLNQHNPGIGATVARFRGLLDLDADIGGWIEDLFDGAQPHVLPYGGDWNDLQAHGIGLLPSIGWPGELPVAAPRDDLDIDDLILRHDPERDTLDIFGPDGQAVAPVYLGAVPQYLILGPVRLLLTLGDPWINASPAGKIDNPRLALEPAPRDVEFRPRWSEGRLVLRRAVWRVAPAQWPVQDAGETDLDYLCRAERWRQTHELPVECFLTLERPSSALDAAKRKPLWMRFDSLHALRRAGAALGDDVVTVRAAEALPGRGEHWAVGADGTARACEHMALLRWERPQ